MDDHAFCRLALKLARIELNKHPKIKHRLKGMHTWSESGSGSRYFEVWTDHDMVWCGTAHCAFEAKSNAIDKYLPEDAYGDVFEEYAGNHAEGGAA